MQHAQNIKNVYITICKKKNPFRMNCILVLYEKMFIMSNILLILLKFTFHLFTKKLKLISFQVYIEYKFQVSRFKTHIFNSY